MTVMTLLLLAAAAPSVHAQEQQQSLSLTEAVPLTAGKLAATGRVQPALSAKVGPRISGRLAEFATDEQGRTLDVGMYVKSGQVLFRLDDTTFANNLTAAQAQLASAKAALANLVAPVREEQMAQLRQALAELDARSADSKQQVQRYQRLVDVEKTLPGRRLEEEQTNFAALQAQRAAAQARLRQAENGPTTTEVAMAEARVHETEALVHAASDDVRDTAVRAPFDGLIVRRNKGPGDYLSSMPPAEVVELVSTDGLEAELNLPESCLASIEPGKTPVLLRSPLLKGDVAAAVTRTVPAVDETKGTFAVRVAIPHDQRGQLAPGAFITGEVTLDDPAAQAQVVVPQRAVFESPDGKAAVFVADGAKMARREVVLGDRLTEGVVVRSGLAPGQKVLLGPPDAMRDGADLPASLRSK
jgi:RND family efflux transporter MFP subunit